MMASAWSSSANFWVAVAACFGSLPVSYLTSFIFLPAMPPLALISSTAMSTDVSVASPTFFKAPDFTMLKPITMSSASAGAAALISRSAAAPPRMMIPNRRHDPSPFSFRARYASSDRWPAQAFRRYARFVHGPCMVTRPSSMTKSARGDVQCHLRILLDQQDREAIAAEVTMRSKNCPPVAATVPGKARRASSVSAWQ